MTRRHASPRRAAPRQPGPHRGQAPGGASRRIGPLPAAALAAAAATIAWLVLALATGLIFHFMPAAPFLAGAWAHRARSDGARAPGLDTTAALLVAGALAAVGIAALVAMSRPLDDPPVTAAAAAGGALLAAAWLRWPAARRESAAALVTAPVTADDPNRDRHPTNRR
jgi:hypothetical protein